ncbi:MAG: trigger factor [Stagnimonas sp.]|nr:trigger factor [Stagnimonas sp.]
MQVQLESQTGLARSLRVQIPAERVEKAVTERMKRMASRAKMPGFRPGKAPMKMIEAQYKDAARYEVMNDLVSQTYGEALDKAQVQPAGQPRIEIGNAAEGLEYTAHFDVYPDITLDKLDSFVVSRPAVEITEPDVDRLIENLRRARKSFSEVTRAAADGDQVTVDFEGKLDGEAFQGGKGEGVSFEVGTGQFLPDLEKGMVGHSAGESFTVDVSFPEDYRAEALKGKTAQFDVTLKTVKELVLPALDDAEFLKAHGVEGADGEAALRAKSLVALENERNKAIKGRVKAQVLDQLLAAHPIDVPQGLIAQELPRLREEAANRMNMGKLTAEKARELLPDALFEATAKRRVALGLLIGEVIKSKGITLDDSKVEQTLNEMATDYEQPEQVKQFYRSRPDLLQGLRAVVLEDQVVDTLMAAAAVTDVPQSLETLLNPQAQAAG